MSIEEGRFIVIQFDQELEGELATIQDRFTVTAPVYTMTPDWEPIPQEIPITTVSWYNDKQDAILIELGIGNKNTLQIAAGPVSIRYAGGNLRGKKGPLLSFIETFSPVGVDYKGDQNNEEHIDVSNITASMTVTNIFYTEATLQDEHVELSGVSVEYTITDIDDL